MIVSTGLCTIDVVLYSVQMSLQYAGLLLLFVVCCACSLLLRADRTAMTYGSYYYYNPARKNALDAILVPHPVESTEKYIGIQYSVPITIHIQKAPRKALKTMSTHSVADMCRSRLFYYNKWRLLVAHIIGSIEPLVNLIPACYSLVPALYSSVAR